VPIVTGFGLIIEAPIVALTAMQCAANLFGGGAQQSTTVKVIFFANTNGFDEFVTVTPFLINFRVQPPGNKKVSDSASKPNILSSCYCN